VTPPSEADLGLVNQPNAAIGLDATVTDVAMSLEKDVLLVEVDGETVKSG
jgi:hypothetical protein